MWLDTLCSIAHASGDLNHLALVELKKAYLALPGLKTITREIAILTVAVYEQAWATAILCLGREGMLALVRVVGYFRYQATILRAFDSQVPAEGNGVER